MEPVQITIIASVILGLTQLITNFFPKINKMNTTLVVTVVVGILSVAIGDSITYITVIMALITEVFGYDLITKSVIPTVKNLRK